MQTNFGYFLNCEDLHINNECQHKRRWQKRLLCQVKSTVLWGWHACKRKEEEKKIGADLVHQSYHLQNELILTQVITVLEDSLQENRRKKHGYS